MAMSIIFREHAPRCQEMLSATGRPSDSSSHWHAMATQARRAVSLKSHRERRNKQWPWHSSRRRDAAMKQYEAMTARPIGWSAGQCVKLEDNRTRQAPRGSSAGAVDDAA